MAEEGPYYLVRVVPSFVATMGGVRTNENYQVLTTEGAAIGGLYAAGEMAHRFLYSRHFISGAPTVFPPPWAGSQQKRPSRPLADLPNVRCFRPRACSAAASVRKIR